MTSGFVIDIGTSTAGAAVVTDEGTWIVTDPTGGANRWPCAMHWDGDRVAVGALAEQQRRADPDGYVAGLKRGLAIDKPVTLGSRRFRPVEQVKELIAAIRQHAHRPYAAGDRGALDRAVLTIPADWLPGDARRSRLVNAAEGAGFGAVELLWEAVAAVSAPLPGRPLGRGDLALVFDLGATFQATLVRVGDGDHEIVGHASVPDWGDREVDVQKVVEVVEYALAGCRELLSRLGIAPGRVDVVLPVGAGSRVPGLDLILERGLGVPVRRVDEPELVVVRGAAHWLTHSGSRAVRAQPSADRMMPLSFTIPGGTAHLLRWLVPTQQPYDEGTSLARIRLAGGAVWELTARTGGTLDQILVDDGSPFSTGEWLAISRH